jgi:hypothetical protein
VLTLGSAAHAATLASAALFATGANINMQCGLTNVGTKTINVTSAKVLSDVGDVTNFQNCVGPLTPGTTCVFVSALGAGNVNPYGVITFSGSVKGVRGKCALFDSAASRQFLSTPLQ